jgi:transcriptional regulator with XRE-family HTH domain
LNDALLRFPGALRRMRVRRGLLQKTIAHQLQLDPGQLCAVERGSRGPLDASTLKRAADLLELSEPERQELAWAAHHDRLVAQLGQRGASPEEIELVSASLEAWHHLRADQRCGLIQSVRKCSESAKLLAALSTPCMQSEGFA